MTETYQLIDEETSTAQRRYRIAQQVVSDFEVIGESPSGKATGFDPVIRRFDPYLLSQFAVQVATLQTGLKQAEILGRVP